MPPSTAAPVSLPSIDEIRKKTTEILQRRPCLWQCEVGLGLLRGDKDIICVSGTGSGKTLTFWIPLLFRPEGIQVIITPLNLLGTQNKKQLDALGISAIAIRGETATYKNIRDIIALKYRVVAVSPEIALKPRGLFEQVWTNTAFMSRLISVVWDEAHLLKAWASFREELGEASRLRNVIPLSKPYLMPSATMPRAVLTDVMEIARVRKESVVIVRRSNDRPNVYLTVRKIRYALSTYKDLAFLIPDGWVPGMKVPKFLIFFDNIEDSLKACEMLRSRLPAAYSERVVWFNADNTAFFRETTTARFQANDIIGLCCTDAFGMGIDIPDIEVVVQWRPTCDLDSMWQRFGRAAREPGREALAILFADAKYFDDEKVAARERADKRRQAERRRAAAQENGKRKRVSGDPSAADESARARKKARAAGESIQGDGANSDQRAPSAGEVSRAARTLVGAAPDAQELSELETLRVLYKTSSAAGGVQGGRKSKKSDNGDSPRIAPELDCFINAATRAYKCYRKPITAFYENDRLSSDRQRCLTADGKDCGRCTLTPSAICCSLCTPAHRLFELLPPLDEPPARSAAPRASQVDTRYKMSELELKLRAALHSFRREQTIREYGLAHLKNYGPSAIMGDDILKRIIDCARAHKIRTLESLDRETKWNLAWELGDDVLLLVNQFYPVPTPLAQTAVPQEVSAPSEAGIGECATATAPANKRAARKCSACGSTGHIRSNESCPNYTPRPWSTTKGKENATPTPRLQHPACIPVAGPSHAQSPSSNAGTATFNTYDQFWASPSYRRSVVSPSELAARLLGM